MRMEQAWILAAICGLGFLPHVLCNESPVTDDPPEAMRAFIIAKSKAGEQPSAPLKVRGGEKVVLTLNKADEKQVFLGQDGLVLPPIPWKEVSPDDLASLGEKLAKDAADFVLLAKLYALYRVKDKAEKACSNALELDRAVAPAVREILANLKPPDPPPAPVHVSTGTGSDAGTASTAPKPSPGQNQEGRTLPPMPAVTKVINFDTPEADAIVSAMQIFPKNHAMNEDVSKLPVHPNSDNIVKFLGAGKKVHTNDDMCYIIVPPNQPRVDVKLRSTYESDKGPYPFPDTTPIEGWPMCGGPLEEIQRKGDGDRHALVIDPTNNLAYEFYNTRRVGSGWEAANCALFDLTSLKQRPEKWTSADAAGLSIFAGSVRYDECERGMVEHAIRVTVSGTRKGYIYPATHDAAGSQDPNAPVMGQRLRLKASVDISRFPPHAQAIAKGMKKYGLIVADNGTSWFISCCPDKRLKGLDALWGLKGTDFEFVQATGPHEGPRAGQ